MLAVEVDELRVEFGSTIALAGIDLTVEHGEVVTLLGANGAGKTTTLETLQGYRRPDRGRVRVLGLDPMTDRRALADHWGVMPQSGGIPMGLTVIEAIELFSRLHRSAVDRADLVDAVGLGARLHHRWRTLSGGEQQRLSLGIALCGGTDVLFLDEPTAALDVGGRQAVLDLVRSRAEVGSAVLVTTHRTDDVEAIADRVVILEEGRVVQSGTLAELTANVDEVRFATVVGLDTSSLQATLGAPVIEDPAGDYRVVIEPTPATVATITAWLAEHGHTAHRIDAGRRRLEDLLADPRPDRGGDRP